MLAVKLVKLIENHSDQLSRELSEKVWNSPRCSDLHKVPADELQARTREIYRNLSDSLLNQTEAELEQRYTELGARRAEQGVAYSHFHWALTATKEHLRSFVQREGLSDSAMDLHGELELMHMLGKFFDRALYYAAVGYERERERIGAKQKRRKGDEQKKFT
ncbi:MAG: hypothetical protein CAF45_016540 [Nitrospira sp. CG24E]|nr:MAG: hypothetical protein CAF45_016540 [Nitrospira sp. CG24E]